ncbi:MAG: hypothetical protein Q9191_001493 [Dirinaria sp. TL-2023a]
MARQRKKKRTHLGASNGPNNGVKSNSSGSRDPKSMVVRIGAGEVGASVSQLVKDVRTMLEPDTASRLKERKANKLRDYTTMAGPLGVSHLLLFSRSNTGNTNLRLALTPRGPTLHFRVETYSLSKDVQKAVKHTRSSRQEYLSPPLLVMNNFISPPSTDTSEPAVPKHLETLTTTIFQSLFPPISPQSTPLSSIRRVLLLNRELTKSPSNGSSVDNGSYTINLRHYAISTKRTGLSRAVRRLKAAENSSKDSKKRRGFINLSKVEDAADYVLDPSAAGGGFTSGSETELETDAEVEVMEANARKVLSRKQMNTLRSSNEKAGRPDHPEVEKKAVKLVEIGPRMRLRMTKVEEGVCGGKVMWHEFISKTKEEAQRMEKVWDARRRETEQRRRAQRENVERKRKEQGKPQVNKAGEDPGKLSDVNEWDEDDFDQDDVMEVDRQEGGVSVG